MPNFNLPMQQYMILSQSRMATASAITTLVMLLAGQEAAAAAVIGIAQQSSPQLTQTSPAEPQPAPSQSGPSQPAPSQPENSPNPQEAPAPPPAPAPTDMPATVPPPTADKEKEQEGTAATVIDGRQLESILGKNVLSPTGENMGRIVDIMADRTGQVRAAIVDFGGFLGVGTRKIAVDWRMLRFPSDRKTEDVVIDLTSNQLRAAPIFKPGEPIVMLGRPGDPH